MARVMDATTFWQAMMRGAVPKGPLVAHGHVRFNRLGHAFRANMV
jgi:hypothetical protein